MIGSIEVGEGFFAVTVNDSNTVLGQHCDVESSDCLWLLATSTDCEEGERYPVLVDAEWLSVAARMALALCSFL